MSVVYPITCRHCGCLAPVKPLYEENVQNADAIADFINPKDLPEGKSIVEYLVEQTDGGLDYTYDATGNVSPWYRPSPPDGREYGSNR